MKSNSLFGWMLIVGWLPLTVQGADLDDITIRMMDPAQPMAIDHVIQLPESHTRMDKRDDRRTQGREQERRRDREQERHSEREQERRQEDRNHESDHHQETERARESHETTQRPSGPDDKGSHIEPGDDKIKK